jgi:hypothetical protein
MADLQWLDEDRPDCPKCEALLKDPVFAQIFAAGVPGNTPVGELGPMARKNLAQCHADGHRLRPSEQSPPSG